MILTEATASDELKGLWDRWLKGVDWLMGHDPLGTFHFWYQSQITPRTPLPAQDEGRRLEYADYYRNRDLWESIDKKCLRLERTEEAALREAPP